MPEDVAQILNRSPEPVAAEVPDEQRAGTSLALSGGGFRAMMFHSGALLRLNEAGFLPHIKQFSSVSGGSITAAVLATSWYQLECDTHGVAHAFDRVESALVDFAGRWVDVPAVLLGALIPGTTIADRLTQAYRKHLFEDATLQDLPDGRDFVINSTSLQTGRLVRFTKESIASYGLGEVPSSELDLASAVAASSAFPPVLSPKLLDFELSEWRGSNTFDDDTYREQLVLADGGVYDNLGLERAAHLHTVLVSDGGSPYKVKPKLNVDWLLQSKRAWVTSDRQVRALRKRQLIAAYQRQERLGSYWGITTDLNGYVKSGLADPLPASVAVTSRLAELATQLRPFSKRDRYLLINWGYVVCDAAIRCHVDKSIPRPSGLPYPKYSLVNS